MKTLKPARDQPRIFVDYRALRAAIEDIERLAVLTAVDKNAPSRSREIFSRDPNPHRHLDGPRQLEAEELFYLQSRGLSEAAARSLLTYGFAAEIVSGIPVPSVVDVLRRRLVQETGAPPHAGASPA